MLARPGAAARRRAAEAAESSDRYVHRVRRTGLHHPRRWGALEPARVAVVPVVGRLGRIWAGRPPDSSTACAGARAGRLEPDAVGCLVADRFVARLPRARVRRHGDRQVPRTLEPGIDEVGSRRGRDHRAGERNRRCEDARQRCAQHGADTYQPPLRQNALLARKGGRLWRTAIVSDAWSGLLRRLARSRCLLTYSGYLTAASQGGVYAPTP